MAPRKSKRYIGRPLTIGNLLAALEDGELYSCSRVASLTADRPKRPRAHQRLRKTLNEYTRRHQFPKGGEDIVEWEGRLVPAWFGVTWKKLLTPQDLEPPPKKPESPASKRENSGPGRKMKYGHFLLDLDPFALYSPESVVCQGKERGLFAGQAEEEGDELKVRKAVREFQREHLPEKPDGLLPKEPAWEGWRWMTALPDYLLDPVRKAQIKRRVDSLSAERTDSLPRVEPVPAIRDDEIIAARPPERPSSSRRLPLKLAAIFVGAAFLAFLFGLTAATKKDDFDIVREVTQHPTQEGIRRLADLMERKDRASVERKMIRAGLLNAIVGMPSKENEVLLRRLLRLEAPSRETIDILAEVQRNLEVPPLVLADEATPIFSAAVAENPMVLYPEGHLQLGDWVSIGDRPGFVTNIHRRGFIYETAGGPRSITFKVPTVLGGFIQNVDTITCWSGRLNLNVILKTICEINDWNYLDFGGAPGHLGGTFHCESYEEFVGIIEEHLSVEFNETNIIKPNWDVVHSYVNFPEYAIYYNHNLGDMLKRYQSQLGLILDFDNLPAQYLTEKRAFVGLQLDEVLNSLGLRARIRDNNYGLIFIEED